MTYTIRKKLTGKKKKRTYQIVATDSRNKRNGKVNEVLGWFDPHTNMGNLKEETIIKLLENGATITDSTVKTCRLLAPRVVRFLTDRKKRRLEKAKQAAEKRVTKTTKKPVKKATVEAK